jgi:hypothetical protein
MSGILDKLNKELEQFGRRAQAALDEGKLQLERMRLRREQDEAARQLGMLHFRKTRGQEIDVLELDAYLVKLDNLAASIAQVERDIAATKREGAAEGETETETADAATTATQSD